MSKIAIVDYGLGNLRSVEKGFLKAGVESIITHDEDEIARSSALVLPGVGSFNDGIKNLSHVKEALDDEVRDGKYLIGICLGMQFLLEESDEGPSITSGLGYIPGSVMRFKTGGNGGHERLKIPHMGWNSLRITRENPIFKGLEGDDPYVYFVHSYHAATEEKYILSETTYGYDFPSIVANEGGNVIGLQFHPEKSGDLGLRMLKNFVEMAEGGV